jgi:hypothetical protein
MTEGHTTVDINFTNSMRSVNKATYVPASVPAGTPRPGQVLEKGAFVRRLAMTGPEYETLRAQAGSGQGGPLSRDVLDLMYQIGQDPWPGGLRGYGPRLAATDHRDLADAGSALVRLRSDARRALSY